MLIAEDLLLLLTDDATGRASVDTTRLDLALAGAVLLELAGLDRIDIAGPGEPVRAGRVVVRESGSTGDVVLDEALRRVAARRPSRPQDLLGALKKDLRPTLLDRLVDRGVLRREEGRVLGIFPTRSWPAADSRHEAGLASGLHDVLVVGRTPTDREAALVSLLSAVDRAYLPVPGADRRAVRRRAKEIATGEFAGAAVRRAVEAVNAATVAAVAAAGAAGATSS